MNREVKSGKQEQGKVIMTQEDWQPIARSERRQNMNGVSEEVCVGDLWAAESTLCLMRGKNLWHPPTTFMRNYRLGSYKQKNNNSESRSGREQSESEFTDRWGEGERGGVCSRVVYI